MLEKKFREVPVDSETGEIKEAFVAAFHLDTNPLIVVDVQWTTTYYKKDDVKRIALEQVTEAQLLLFPWGGKYATDVFEITADQAWQLLRQI